MDQIISEFNQKAQAVIKALMEELSSVRSNRPSPALVEDLKIEYFENQVPLKQLGSISVMGPRTIVITLWDASSAEQVRKAIEDTKRFNPSLKGGSIYINLPPLSQERRDELIKLAKSMVEKYKIQLRGLRDEANKRLTSLDLSEDDLFLGKKKIQEAIDKTNKDIEELLSKKVKEISE